MRDIWISEMVLGYNATGMVMTTFCEEGDTYGKTILGTMKVKILARRR